MALRNVTAKMWPNCCLNPGLLALNPVSSAQPCGPREVCGGGCVGGNPVRIYEGGASRKFFQEETKGR